MHLIIYSALNSINERLNVTLNNKIQVIKRKIKMIKTIKIKIENKYGNELIYPVCENAKLLAQLAGTKTLTQNALATIKLLGYQIELQQNAIPSYLSNN